MLKVKTGNSRELMVFCRQLATLITAGVTVLTSIQILKNQHRKGALTRALHGTARALENGRSLSRSFAKETGAFSPLFISMVEAGESGGKLDEVLERLAVFYEKDHDLRQRLKTALIYPLLILLVTCTAMVFIVIRVLPAYTDIFRYFDVELPHLTRFLLNLGQRAERRWYLMLPGLVLCPFLAAKGLSSRAGRAVTHRFLVRVPVYGPLYRQAMEARFARILGILLNSGVTLMTSLELVEKAMGNHLYAALVRLLRSKIGAGQGISPTLRGNRLFTPMAVEMMAVGEQTGTLDLMLHKIADFTEGEIRYTVDRLSTLVEPVLILILAIFVGVIALSVFMPMLDMFELIR